MAKMISVSDELKDEIDTIKEKEGHTTLDSVIRSWKKDSDAYKVLLNELKKQEK